MNTDTKTRTAVSAQYVVGAIIVPLAILIAGSLAPLLWKAQLPADIPLHWGTDGPDRWGTVYQLVFPLLGIGSGLILILGSLGIKIGKETTAQRVLVLTNSFVAALFASITLGTAFESRNLASAADVPLNNWWIVGGIVGGLLIGGVLAIIIPKRVSSVAVSLPPADAVRAPLADTENAVWVQREVSTPSMAIGIFAVVVITGATILSQFWGMLALSVVLAALLATMFVWDLRVDATGFYCASGLKVFRRKIPLAEIIEAKVVDTRALRDFGGYGWRTALDGATGIILRSGESLELVLTDSRVFVATTNDAVNAAGLVNTLIERSRA